MDEAMLKAVQRLKQLIGKEPTTYPEDIIGINSLIMLLLHFQKKKGWEPKETYRQIELAAMPMHELQKLSREEYEKAMECREAARKAGFIPPTWCRCGVDHMPAQSNSFTTSRAVTVR